ncbi:hypothetical protein [Streptomyces sp. NPDC000410]|uniref:hypothetical protein n=1 Tax=Streptomyces sp. NPDC000410 TaxID=3154254 RepID=UPI00332394E5
MPQPGFEDPSEARGVAIGRHRGTTRVGTTALGSYVMPDFHGWVKLLASERAAALAGRAPDDYSAERART